MLNKYWDSEAMTGWSAAALLILPLGMVFFVPGLLLEPVMQKIAILSLGLMAVCLARSMVLQRRAK